MPRTALTPFETRALQLACDHTTLKQHWNDLGSVNTHEGSVFLEGKVEGLLLEMELEIAPEDSDAKIVKAVKKGIADYTEDLFGDDRDARWERTQLGC